MGQSVQGYLEKVPMEARWDLASGGLITFNVSYFKALFDQGGKEKLVDFVKQRAPITAARYKGFADRFGLTGTDPKSSAAIIPAIVTLVYGPQQKYEIEETTAEKARFKCINCAFWNGVQAQKITDDLCSANSQYVLDAIAKALNPKLSCTLLKARPFGDSICEWDIELKA